MKIGRNGTRLLRVSILFGAMLAGSPRGRGQEPASAPAADAGVSRASQPPAAVPPSPSLPAPGPPSREAALEERLRRMEQANEQLLKQLQDLSQKYDQVSQRLTLPPVGTADGETITSSGSLLGSGYSSGPEGTIGRGFGRGLPGTAGRRLGEGSGGGTAATRAGLPGGGGGREEGVGPDSARGPQGTISRTRESHERVPVKVVVDRGMRFSSEDDEYQLIFHNLTQAQYTDYPYAGDQSPLKNQFFIPRQRWYFQGQATKDVQFYTVINRGYGALDLLDGFIDFNFFGPKFRLRVGRTKVPNSYEYYQIAEGDLIAPERSLYTGNFSGNRQDGAMLHGRILDERAEYAIGVFNGPRRSFQDYNNNKDLFTFFNIRPFEKSTTLKALNVMNIGGAFDFGNQFNPTQPGYLTTANDQSTINSEATVRSLSPTFLVFNNNVIENGMREHWSAWIAWYYKSFNILAQYDGGFQDYSVTGGNQGRVRVPMEGFFVQPYYFITGEQIKRRVDVTPLRNFSIRNGRITGPGALEVHVRYSALNLGSSLFSGGLADPNLWSNHAQAIDLGFNWYPNQYTKVYFDWQHSMFGNPISNGVDSFKKTANILWIRWQLFF